MSNYKVTFQVNDDYSITDLDALNAQLNDLIQSTIAPALSVSITGLEVKKGR